MVMRMMTFPDGLVSGVQWHAQRFQRHFSHRGSGGSIVASAGCPFLARIPCRVRPENGHTLLISNSKAMKPLAFMND
eukprot:2666160-Amphidinium_carterae.1